MKSISKKTDDLKTILKKLEKVIVAFSGGKDSFFLMKTALDVLGKENVKIIFINSDFISENDRKRITYFEEKFNLNIIRLEISVLNDKTIMKNPKDRCYFCKSFIFNNILTKSKELGVDHILDGTTLSDMSEYRPGVTALEELKILSPLKDAGISSQEIVDQLKKEDIDRFYLTSSACLATRFPYDHKLSEKDLRKFDRIEDYLVNNGIYPVRVRYIEDGIRIETEEHNTEKVLKIKNELIKICKNEKMKFITLDLEGLRSGVWDKDK